MKIPQGILTNRTVLGLVTIFCFIEAVWSWTDLIRGVRHRPDLITALFSSFVILIAVSIAYRSSFWADRITFGIIACVGVVIVLRAAPWTSATYVALDVTKSCLWSGAALINLIVKGSGGALNSPRM